MKKILSLLLILASSAVLADQNTLTKLEAANVGLSVEQADTIRAAEGDDALIQAILNLIEANASDPLTVKVITRAAVDANPNLVIAITNYAILVAPSARIDICLGALEQTRNTAIAVSLTQQESQCRQVVKFADFPGTQDLQSNNDEQAIISGSVPDGPGVTSVSPSQ